VQFFKKITEGLKKTRDAFVERVSDVLKPGKKLEPEDYEALEAALLRADVGPATADRILEEVKERLAKGADDPAAALREAVRAVIEPPAPPAAGSTSSPGRRILRSIPVEPQLPIQSPRPAAKLTPQMLVRTTGTPTTAMAIFDLRPMVMESMAPRARRPGTRSGTRRSRRR